MEQPLADFLAVGRAPEGEVIVTGRIANVLAGKNGGVVFSLSDRTAELTVTASGVSAAGLQEGASVRVRGTMRANVFAASAVEVTKAPPTPPSAPALAGGLGKYGKVLVGEDMGYGGLVPGARTVGLEFEGAGLLGVVFSSETSAAAFLRNPRSGGEIAGIVDDVKVPAYLFHKGREAIIYFPSKDSVRAGTKDETATIIEKALGRPVILRPEE